MENVIYLVMLSSSNSFIENCNEYIDISSYSYIFCVVSLTFSLFVLDMYTKVYSSKRWWLMIETATAC